MAEKYGIKIHYAVKANVERRLLEYISGKGFGADCVSGNEVLHAHDCGFPGDKIVYAGVGKSDKEIYNALKIGICQYPLCRLRAGFRRQPGRFQPGLSQSLPLQMSGTVCR